MSELESSGCIFRSENSIFGSCLSDKSFELLDGHGSNRRECIRNEAVLISKPKTWSSFLCLLALSSVTCTKMLSHYPKCNNAISHFLNREILPRTDTDVNFGKAIHFLWTRCGNLQTHPQTTFVPNHFVPLFIDAKGKTLPS